MDYRAGETLLVDKDLGWTSFDVVNKLRYALKALYGVKKFKVGHAGTLDPLASGLLLICTGKKTKEIDGFTGLDKEYTGTISLGATTETYDLESEVQHVADAQVPDLNALKEAMSGFVGSIQQTPPRYSAKRINGQKSYERARKGEQFQPKSVEIRINSFEIVAFKEKNLDFILSCSKGTYVRSLAHDLGEKLGCGGHLSALRRTAIGSFRVEESMSVEDWVETIKKSPSHAGNNVDLNL